jgi:glycosyltransferase involved in cell wall biosynthesis
MKVLPLLSVVIPVYKVEKYIDECLNSVLKQTYSNIEIILVDDGSPDNCPQICDDYAKKDDRIKVIHKKNGGASSARNVGMGVLSGDYFIFLDSDDYWNDVNFLENIVKYSLQNQPDFVIFGYTKNLDLLNSYIRNTELEDSICCDSKSQTLHQLIIYDKLHSSPCNKLIKTDLIRENELDFIEGIYSEDIDWIARVIISSKTIVYYDDYVYFYRENKLSVTHNLKRKNIIDLKNQIIRIVDYSNKIEQEDYYEWFMNYCAYQYITFLNCVVTVDKSENVSEFVDEMKKYAYLLNYHINNKVNIVYKFYKFFGYKGMLRILKVFLKIRG